MQRRLMTEIVNHSRSTALVQSVKILLRGVGVVCVCVGGGGLKSILRGHNPRP